MCYPGKAVAVSNSTTYCFHMGVECFEVDIVQRSYF